MNMNDKKQPAGRPSIANVTSVFKACDELTAKGERITALAVKKAIGGGSMSSVGPLIKEWKKQADKKALESVPPMPKRVTDTMTVLWAELYRENSKLFDDELKHSLEKVNELETDNALYMENIEELERANDDLHQDIIQLKEQLKASEVKRQELELSQQVNQTQISALNDQIITLKDNNQFLKEQLVEKIKQGSSVDK